MLDHKLVFNPSPKNKKIKETYSSHLRELSKLSEFGQQVRFVIIG